MEMPLISVIIPCYNSAKYIVHALDSMLCQTYKNIEIVIIDDHSTDNIAEVVASYLEKYSNKIRFEILPFVDTHRYDRRGVNINAGWAARNYGVEISRGELITFQDSDDGSCSNRIEFQYDIMQRFKSHHVNVDWQQYKDEYNCKYLDYKIQPTDIIETNEILSILKKNRRGFFKRPFGRNENKNPFEKIIRTIDRKFFRDWPSYPCAASMPLLKKEVFEKCHFRELFDRTMPASGGRGADCDFNFWVAETFKDSIAVRIPLILWRAPSHNLNYVGTKYQPK